jgi:cyclohexyl-isocyanide hydratase
MPTLEIGFLAFPRITQLDLTGPLEVLAHLPGARIHVVARDRAPVVAESGLVLLPSTTLHEAPQLDVLCVPGGLGVNAILEDDPVLDWLAAQGARARFVTSICTGALALGAAGLLRGFLATTHWLAIDLLPIFGATPISERVVVDRNRVTGGGVTAGIDFGLTLAAQLAGEETARRIALALEYAPAPLFPGSPRSAAPALVNALVEGARAGKEERRRLCQAAVARRGRR